MELEDEEHEALFPALAMCLQFNEQVRGRGRGMGRGRGRVTLFPAIAMCLQFNEQVRGRVITLT